MPEWPAERIARATEAALDRGLANESIVELLRETEDRPRGSLGSRLRVLVDAILKAYEGRLEPNSAVSELNGFANAAVSSVGTEHFAASEATILAMGCVDALRRAPTVTMWEYIWSLAWHSGSLQQGLPPAVLASAAVDPLFKKRFLDIASGVVKNAAGDPGRRAISREQSRSRQLREDWKQKSTLSTLWQGIDFDPSDFGRDDDGILGIVADLDLVTFVRLLEVFDSPHPVASALTAARANRSFSRWKTLMSVAPIAFDDTRHWNGSPILPLLLNICREQLESRRHLQVSTDDSESEADEIACLTGEIAKALGRRHDGAACAARWATWLIRRLMAGLASEQVPFPVDVRSRGYADSALIDALAKEIDPQAWLAQSSSDAEPWEPWCYRCVLVTVAQVNGMPMPTSDDFLREWVLTPEDWMSERGQNLKARASLFQSFGKRPDAYGTRVLALPLAEAPSPENVWTALWNSTSVIREIIEFGDADSEPDEGWRGQSEASGLVRFAFGLGLMMMDKLITSSQQMHPDRQATLRHLLGSLTDAVREMMAINQFDHSYWSEAARHLAIRRAIWLANGSEATGSAAAAFEDNTTPTLADFIRDLSGDLEGLFALIDVALRNGVNFAMLKRAVIKAGINLRADIDLGERLLELDPKRAGLSSEQLAQSRALLE